MNILQMSVQAGLLTAIVIAIRAAALYKLPRTSFLFLWGIVLLRMLIPFSVSTKWSFYNIFSNAPIGIVWEKIDLEGKMADQQDDFAHIQPEVPAGQGEVSDVPSLISPWRHWAFNVPPVALRWLCWTSDISPVVLLRFCWTSDISPVVLLRLCWTSDISPVVLLRLCWTSGASLLAVLWVCGAAVLAILFGAMLIRSRRVLRGARPVDREPFLAEWLALRRILRPLKILRSARAASPLSMGVLRPCIILPEKMDMSDERFRYILAHEYIHVCRFDMLWKLLALCGVCIHWFNPMSWVMLFLLNRDLELSCDEMVLRYTAGADRAEYAGSLLDMAEQNRSFSLIHNYFGKNAIEERILSIMRYKKTSILSLISASVIVAGTAAVFATSAQAGNGHISLEEQDRMSNAAAEAVLETLETSNIISYVDPQDGRTYYSFDDGETFEPLTEEEYEQRFPTPDVEWWTYEEYAAWLENEKKELQSLIGEKAWTGGRGDFVWTQEIVDETIAVYEKILQDIKNGLQVSRSVDGNDDVMLSYNPADVELGTSERMFELSILLSNGEQKVFGPYETREELLAEVVPFCEEQVRLGNMEQSEADEIIGSK